MSVKRSTSLKKEANGRRSVQVEVEVPGTPEQVWQAIATGPGVGAWLCPQRSMAASVARLPTTSEGEWTPPRRSPNGMRRIAS